MRGSLGNHLANQIVGDVLQAEAQSDSYSTGRQAQRREADAYRLQDEKHSNQQRRVVEHGADGLPRTGVQLGPGQQVPDEPTPQAADYHDEQAEHHQQLIKTPSDKPPQTGRIGRDRKAIIRCHQLPFILPPVSQDSATDEKANSEESIQWL